MSSTIRNLTPCGLICRLEECDNELDQVSKWTSYWCDLMCLDIQRVADALDRSEEAPEGRDLEEDKAQFAWLRETHRTKPLGMYGPLAQKLDKLRHAYGVKSGYIGRFSV